MKTCRREGFVMTRSHAVTHIRNGRVRTLCGVSFYEPRTEVRDGEHDLPGCPVCLLIVMGKTKRQRRESQEAA